MSQVNPTIIAGTLDDSELLKSIKEIVNAVDSGMDEVSDKFDTKLTEIEEKFKDAGTKIGTAFKYSFNSALGGSFDQLAAAMEKISNSSGKFLNNFGGGNGGAKDLLSQIEEVEEQIKDLKIKGITNEEDKARLDAMIEKLQKLQKEKERLEQGPETVADLDKIIAMEEHRRKKMELESSELLEQNKYLQQAKDYRKEQLATEEQLAKAAEKEAEAIERAESKKLKKEQEPYVKELNRAITMPAKDIDQAQAKLDRLQETKERMVQTGLFDEAQLNRAQNAIDNLQKKIQQIQSKTPKTLKEVMGMDESSVDEITKKMKALRGFKIGNEDDARKVREEYQRLSNLQSEMLGKNAKLTDSTSLLGKSLTYIVKRLAFIASFALFKGFTSEIVRIRGEYEMLERSLGILIGDMSKGTAIFRQLNAMALQSPFTLMDLAGAAKQLTAYNFAANEVVDTTRRLGDISAALGVPMERLVYNLGQIRAQNVLNARDARDFANAGFAIVPMLAELYTEQKRFGDEIVTTAKVYDMMSKKMVSYADVMQVINKITDEGGKFFDFQSKQADTLKVRIANLSLAYNNMLNEIGKSNQGTMNNVIDFARRMFLNWREVVRVLNTLIVTYGVYRTGIYLTSMSFKRGLVSVRAWMNGIKASTGAMSAFKAALTPNVIIAFATALASAISYFVLFNNSAEETKQKMREITEAFDGIRKNASDLFVAALNTDNLNMQMPKLRELLDLAKNELGITIPVNLEDVNEGNIKQKIQEIKDRLDEYLNFAQAFSESASKTKLNETFNDFGKNAQRVFTGIYESQKTVIEALIKLQKEGRATADELDVLNELLSGRGADESRLDYLRRLISLYERLGIIMPATYELGQAQAFGSLSYSQTGGWDYKIEETQAAIKRLGITNNTVFRNMQVDANTFFTSYNAAYNEFQKTVENIGKRIDVDKIPITERTIKLEAAINEEATRNNWNEYQKQFAKQLANERFGVNIEISEESKSHAETNLKEWQKRLQSWADKNKITLGIAFTENQTPADVASQALQNLKNAQESYQTELRKKGVGTATQEEVDKAKKALEEARKVARATGADLSSLNKGAKKDPLGDAFAKEVQVIGDITKRYKEYQQIGVSAQDAIRLATDEYGNTLARLNAQLGKYGIATKTSEELASMDIRGIRDYYKTLLEGAKNANNAKGIEALEKALAGINVEITNLDYKKITDGLNNELSKLKDEYELAVELDANPEMSNLFMELFDIDPNALPHSIDDYAQRVLDKLNKSFEDRKIDFRLPTLKNLTKDDIKAYKEQLEAGIIDKATFDEIEKAYNDLYAIREKDAKETLKSTQELQYKLADVNGKIAIEQKKLADLEVQYQKEADAEKKRLLGLQIQDQRNTIAELQSQALALMPEYERVFGSIIEHSAHTSRRLQKDLLDVYNKATRNANGDYVLTGRDGSTTILTEERYTRERNKLTKEMQKSMSDFNKIKEAFEPSDEDDVVDYAKGIELVGSEIQKLGALMGTIGNIADGLGFSEESVEILNDVSATLDGLGQATQGYAKIMNGDVIGGLTDMVTGLWNSISAWTDNSDKRITREVEKSERAVRRLELAYKDLEYEVNKAYGTAAVSARQLAIENKKLQLAELERQLALEESRSGKKRDEDRIIDIKGQIKDLRNEINDSIEEITNTLLGISSVGDAVENMVGVVIEALRNGESGIDAFNNSIDDMIFNLMKKWASTKYLAPIVEKAMDEINAIVNNKTTATELARLQAEQINIQEALSQAEKISSIAATENIIAQLKERYAQNERAIEEAMGSFGMDETKVASIKEILEGLKQEGQGLTDFLNLIFDNFGVDVSGTTANLSALQQGIQGITEDTAGALEAITNGISQQCYLQSDLLTQIRDAVVKNDTDVSLATQAQMLLQLQQSYAVQVSIQNILNGVLNPSGRAFSVEIIS